MAKKYTLPAAKYLSLRDMAIALEYGSVPADKRIQVKMPSIVVEELDRLFPTIDRSKLLTQLALEAILHTYRFVDRPDLGDLAASEQAAMDEMWNYLEERDAQ
ncbi:MAG TPA: hypothetical protein VF209_03840 [Patescibacteria group bacterium]